MEQSVLLFGSLMLVLGFLSASLATFALHHLRQAKFSHVCTRRGKQGGKRYRDRRILL